MEIIIHVDLSEFEITILPNNIVRVRVKRQFIELEEGYPLFERMGIKWNENKTVKQEE